MYDKIISEDPFNLKYCHNRYMTQQMYNKSIDDFLSELKFVLTNKMIKKLHTALYADDDILYFREDCSDAIFLCNEMVIFSIDPNDINVNDTNFDEDDPETIIHIRPLAWHIIISKTQST